MVQAFKESVNPSQDKSNPQGFIRSDNQGKNDSTVKAERKQSSDDGRKAFINWGYAGIVNSCTEVSGVDRLIGNLWRMHELTGAAIPVDLHEKVLDWIAGCPADCTLKMLEAYLQVGKPNFTQADADKFYARIMYHENNGVIMSSPGNFKKLYRLYEMTGIKSSNDSDMRRAYARQKSLDCYPDLIDYFLNKKDKNEVVSFLEKVRLPVHGVVAIKIEFGMPVSKDEVKQAYEYVMNLRKANGKVDRLGGIILGLKSNPVLESLKQDLERVVDRVNDMNKRTLFKEDANEAKEVFEAINKVMDGVSKLGLVDLKGLREMRKKIYDMQETFLGSFYHSSTPIEGQRQCLMLQKLLKDEIAPTMQNAT